MHKTHTYSRITAVIVGLFFIGLLSFTLFYLYKQSRVTVDRVIANDIEKLVKIFASIDETCEITSIMHNRASTDIDFLNIKEFSGNQIGALQLRNPSKWEGPYVEKAPTAQGKMYELIQVKDGFAIAPGKGVKLASGKVIGKDIILTKSTELEPYLTQEGGLESEGRPLAAKLTLRNTNVIPPLVINEEGV
jgi:hypothetical protein